MFKVTDTFSRVEKRWLLPYNTNMSKFMVNLIAINPGERQRRTPPVEVMVDTGSEVSWLPKKELQGIGITPEGKKRFAMANKQIIERDIGYAILTAEGYSTIDEVVFAEDSDMSLLGVRTLEGFSVMVDNIGHRFVATTSLVC
jgi:predicted aspartyl protease